VIASSTQAVMKNLPTMGSAAGDAVKKTGEAIKGLFEQKKK
jgi:hypothetical protein